MLSDRRCCLAALFISSQASSVTRTLCTQAISRCSKPSSREYSMAETVPLLGVPCGAPTVPTRIASAGGNSLAALANGYNPLYDGSLHQQVLKAEVLLIRMCNAVRNENMF